ncbi:NADH-ubiquinone oxidoreductase-F iron-sulfur binding region domain-containing protein [Sinomonas atrocyanea]|uniref:NADH-ubiquinone oxidoreductase-F iron-sulfur binding region domain-containing protein n=1 Tax=Sinomonas atrocyanea TaxID=37927 RepID=UPI003D974344
MTETALGLPALGTGRLFASAGPDLAAHGAAYGPRSTGWTREALLAELEASGLAGRGGAGFPAWRKLSTLGARRAVVVANGAEGEPLSRKDAALLTGAPHLVLDGLLTAAEALNASQLFVYAPAASLAGVAAALAERRDGRRISLVESPGTFVSGEASAVVSALETGVALPRDSAARLTTTGYRGLPTLVHNVETLAQLGLVARYGADWFRTAGTDDDPGTRLVSVSGDVPTPRVAEVPGGTPLRDILLGAGADPGSLAAVLVGGFHGAWVPAKALDRRATAAGLAEYGARPGAGVLLALGAGRCGLAAAAPIARYLAEGSARQCGPCTFGLPAMAAVLERIAAGERSPWLAAEAERLAGLVTGRGACHHPDATAGFVRSTLTVFRAEVRAHLNADCTGTQGWRP